MLGASLRKKDDHRGRAKAFCFERKTQMTLRERCEAIANKMISQAIARHGSPASTLMDFVLSERGKVSMTKLDETDFTDADLAPLVLYFKTEQDREDFLAVIEHVRTADNNEILTRKTL
jgi:hypothetical protein